MVECAIDRFSSWNHVGDVLAVYWQVIIFYVVNRFIFYVINDLAYVLIMFALNVCTYITATMVLTLLQHNINP